MLEPFEVASFQDMAEEQQTGIKVRATGYVSLVVAKEEGKLQLKAQFHPQQRNASLNIQIQYASPDTCSKCNTKAKVSSTCKAEIL